MEEKTHLKSQELNVILYKNSRMPDPLIDILKMSVSEKVDVIEKIWNSIDENSLPVSDDELTIAKERYEDYLKNPGDVIPWEKAQEALKKKYGF